MHVIERLPREIRLKGWLGPTLFTSEVCDREPVALAEFREPLTAHEHARSFVIGSVRETQGSTATAYAAFCVDPGTGNVVVVDLDPPYRTRFVNTGPETFAASLDAFAAAWPQLTASDEAAATGVLDELRSKLAAIDAAAVADPDDFWPASIEGYS